MTAIYTLVTPVHSIEHQTRIRPIPDYAKWYQARPGNTVPVITTSKNATSGVEASWGIRSRGTSIAQISMEKIMTRKPYNLWFRKYRCAIPANCFYTGTDEKPHLVRILKQRLFMIGGICLPPSVTGGDWEFAMLTTDAADVLQSVTKTMPVVFQPHRTESWIREQTMLKIMQMADRSGEYWFDYYRVHTRIVEPKWNERELLKPLGISFREWQERNETLNALDLKDDRFDRRNSKGRR